ncbi:FAD/NAD(P)-binding domain-containing protein, partial [Trichoderma asperelloides]
MADSEMPRFKVIIVGGSVVGLTTAVALEKAGIDYVLFEKGEIAPDIGNSISIYPHTQRIMEQLGVWPEIKAVALPLGIRHHYDKNGKLFEDSAVFKEVSKMVSQRWTTFVGRRFMLSCIYNQIEDKSRLRTQTCVTSFTETEDGVEVATDKGETIKGDLLLGADGIHSTIRELMAEKLAITNAAASNEMRTGFTSTYHCIFGTSKNARVSDGQEFLPNGGVRNVYYLGFSGVAAIGIPGLIFWFVFIKSDKETRMPGIPNFTEEETKAAIAKYGDYAFGPGYTFKDLWDSRVKASMLPLEDGILKSKWNTGGRVALMGDSVHKSTINLGLGGNLAVEGVVHLVNELVPLVRGCEASGRKPTRKEITAVLDAYEEKQRPHAKTIVTISGYFTRYEAMETWWLRILRHVSPWISDKRKAKIFVGYINEAPRLNFLPNPDE